LSLSGRSIATQFEPDWIEADTAVHSSAVVGITITDTIPSVVLTSQEPASATTAVSLLSRHFKIHSQQQPTSLQQEFSLLNLDMPNITIHDVCRYFSYLQLLLLLIALT